MEAFSPARGTRGRRRKGEYDLRREVGGGGAGGGGGGGGKSKAHQGTE